MTVENIRRTQRQEKERSQPVRIVLTLITISVEDFTDREKRYYRELLLLRSCRKRLHVHYYRGNVAGVEEDLSLGV
jgi:hypothetical protein